METTPLAPAALLLLAQAPTMPLDRLGAAGQVWPFLLAGIVILAVAIWAVTGGIRKRHQH